MRECICCVNALVVANTRELTYPHSIKFCSDRDVLPDCSPPANNDVANQLGVGSDPCISDAQNTVVEWNSLSVARGVLHNSDVIGQSGAKIVE